MRHDSWLQFFATPEEEEKRQQAVAAEPIPAAPAEPAAPQKAIYGGTYDNQIRDLFTQITNTQPFNYDVNGDALFQQYKDQYVRQAQDAMRDTLGQTASLTGGYGNSYGHMAGQQIYDRTMQGLTDKIPELADQAYARYQGDLGQMRDNLAAAGTLGAAEQATQNQNYSNLYNLIVNAGYNATPDELNAAGISQDQADTLRYLWAYEHPQEAVRTGSITTDEYEQLTGKKWSGGATLPYTGGANGGNTIKLNGVEYAVVDVQKMLNEDPKYNVAVDGVWGPETSAAWEDLERRRDEALRAQSGGNG